MSTKLPPLNWLRAFEASARLLSFTQAAQELHLTQAAVSKQVKLLELYLREQLFVRKPRSLLLTKTGAAYLPKVRDAFERLAAGTQEVFGNRRSDALTIRCTIGYSVNWLGPRLPDFMARYPETSIRIVSSVWNEESDTEKFDLDIRYGTGNWPGIRSHRLTYDTITPLCSPKLLEGNPALREPADLLHHRLIDIIGYVEGWGLWLNAAGVEAGGVKRGPMVDTSLIAFEVAAKGAGIALGRSSVMGNILETGRLVAPFDLRLPINEAFHLVSPQDGTEHPDTPRFRDWLLENIHRDTVQTKPAAELSAAGS